MTSLSIVISCFCQNTGVALTQSELLKLEFLTFYFYFYFQCCQSCHCQDHFQGQVQPQPRACCSTSEWRRRPPGSCTAQTRTWPCAWPRLSRPPRSNTWTWWTSPAQPTPAHSVFPWPSKSCSTTQQPLASPVITRRAGLMPGMEAVEVVGRTGGTPVRIITAEYKTVRR